MGQSMDGNRGPDRREFVRRAGGAAWGAWAAVNLVACQDASEYAREAARSGTPFQTLTDDEARAVEAICATIIPSTDTPGATEAGAVHFIDRMLGTLEAGNLPAVRKGLERLGNRVAEASPPVENFGDLTPAERIPVMEAVVEEDAGFFGLMRYLTICGTFSHPDLGGNRDRAGWELLGMDVQSAYQPPFGYYDAPFHEGGSAS